MPTSSGVSTYWSCDVRVSMPVPSPLSRGATMNGFVFTSGGLAHEISDADFQRLSTPDFHPGASFADLVYEDDDLDAPPKTILGTF